MEDVLNALTDAVFAKDMSPVKDLCVIVEQKPEPVEETQCAVFRRENDCIGISSWALSSLYVEAKRQLSVLPADLRAATAMLVINPEHMRAWSIRKEHFTQTSTATELAFSALILRRSPKSAETWSHRSWVLRHVDWNSALVAEELRIARVAASRARSNYYAGVHRRRVLGHASNIMVLKELVNNRTWLQMHVGDSSGWWYHRTLLVRLMPGENFDVAEESAFITDMHARYGSKYQCVKTQFMWWEQKTAHR